MTEDSKRISMFASEQMLDQWDKEAEELNMSRSEYIRSMVTAGRRQISQLDPQSDQEKTELREQVLACIPEEEAKDVDDIVNEVVGPMEDKIRSKILPHLDENGEIRFNPQEGGYERV